MFLAFFCVGKSQAHPHPPHALNFESAGSIESDAKLAVVPSVISILVLPYFIIIIIIIIIIFYYVRLRAILLHILDLFLFRSGYHFDIFYACMKFSFDRFFYFFHITC